MYFLESFKEIVANGFFSCSESFASVYGQTTGMGELPLIPMNIPIEEKKQDESKLMLEKLSLWFTPNAYSTNAMTQLVFEQ